MTWVGCRLAALLCAGLLAARVVVAEPGPDSASIGELQGTPTLDGRVVNGEGWEEATAVAFGAGVARVGWRDRSLFIALRLPVPDTGLLRRVRPREGRDAPSLLDDSIEVWLGGAAPGAPLGRIIANANDALWDAEYRNEAGGLTAHPEWSSGARTASRVQGREWSAELQLALPEGAQSDGLRLRIVHHGRRPDREQGWPSTPEDGGPELPLARVVLAGRARPTPFSEPREFGNETAACALPWPDGLAGAVLNLAWLPYTANLRLSLDLSSVPAAERLRTAVFSLRRAGTSAPLWGESITLVDRRADVTRRITDLADGSYEVAADLSPGPGCTALAGPRRRFDQRHFGWEHNRLGKDDDVIPPFTPLTVEGRSVRAVLREYLINDLGLPDQITSAGEPLLSAPARYRIRTIGRDREPIAEGPIRIARESAGRVRTETTWNAGGLRVRSAGSFEMDGMWRIDLEVSGRSEQIERFDLVVPLRADRATLFNAITDGTMRHALGALPSGEGVVWNSRNAGRWALSPDWVPYIWIGDEERGLAWFAESRRGWWSASGAPAQELVRRGDVLELVVHLTAGGASEGERRITFGLQATPAKPRPEQPRSWRTWQLVCSAPFAVFRLCPLASGLYWGTETPFGNVYPRGADYSLLQHFARVRRGAPPSQNLVEDWNDQSDVSGTTSRSRLLDHLYYTLDAVARQPDAVALYVNTHGSAWTPEFAIYQDEWRAEPFGDRAGRDANDDAEIKVRASPSWNDYVLWNLDRLLETGAADGFFFDNTYLKADFNELEGAAYRDENGLLVPGVDLFAMRDLLKRAQILAYRKRGAWLDISHMTTTPIVPLQVWAGVSLDGEWKYGTDDYQDRFPRDFLRAASLGVQTGTVSAYLPGLTAPHGSVEYAGLERSLAGVTALHEIRVLAPMTGALQTIWSAFSDFGYGLPDTAVGHYWDRNPVVTLSGVDAEALSLTRDGRTLVLLVSFGPSGDVTVRLDGFDRAGTQPNFGCGDIEGRAPTPRWDGGGCHVHLQHHDFRLIALGPPGS